MLQLIQKSSGVGVVCAVDSGRVVVAPMPLRGGDDDIAALPPDKHADGRKGCVAIAGCGSCGGRCGVMPRGGFRVSINNADDYRPGDRVRYVRYVPEPNLASLLTFGTPIIFVMATIFYRMTADPRPAESIWTPVAAAAAFITGVVIVSILDKLFKLKYPSSIINDAEAAQ